MNSLNKLKKNGNPKTTFELSIKLLESKSHFEINDFLKFVQEVEINFIAEMRKNRIG